MINFEDVIMAVEQQRTFESIYSHLPSIPTLCCRYMSRRCGMRRRR